MVTIGTVTDQLTTAEPARLEPWTAQGMALLSKRAVAMEKALRHISAGLHSIFAAGLFDHLPADRSHHEDHNAGTALLDMMDDAVRQTIEVPDGYDVVSFELSRIADKLNAAEVRHA